MTNILEVKNLAKFFENTKVLKDINLVVEKKDVVAIIGPSGSGKSTFLRCLNLLEEPTRGSLSLNGNNYFKVDKCLDDFIDYDSFNNDLKKYEEELVVAEDNYAIETNLLIEGKVDKHKNNVKELKHIYKKKLKERPIKEDYINREEYKNFIKNNKYFIISEKEKCELRQKMTMVFQSFNLFNNMDVLKNCIIAQTKIFHRTYEEAKQVAIKNLTLVNMQDRMNYRVSQLSGGQKQRVAIARALCINPEIILFDEPTSALDPEMVGEVLETIKSLAKSGITMIIVTHEMCFAKNTANKIVFMENGYVVESGTPNQIFNHPTNLRTKEFLKSFNR